MFAWCMFVLPLLSLHLCHWTGSEFLVKNTVRLSFLNPLCQSLPLIGVLIPFTLKVTTDLKWGLLGASQAALVVKNPPACAGDMRNRFDPWVGKIPWGGHGNPLQYSCLENPMDRRAWWASPWNCKEQDMIEQRAKLNRYRHKGVFLFKSLLTSVLFWTPSWNSFFNTAGLPISLLLKVYSDFWLLSQTEQCSLLLGNHPYHRTGKGQFSFQSQRQAMPNNAQTTAQLHSSHTLVK